MLIIVPSSGDLRVWQEAGSPHPATAAVSVDLTSMFLPLPPQQPSIPDGCIALKHQSLCQRLQSVLLANHFCPVTACIDHGRVPARENQRVAYAAHCRFEDCIGHIWVRGCCSTSRSGTWGLVFKNRGHTQRPLILKESGVGARVMVRVGGWGPT